MDLRQPGAVRERLAVAGNAGLVGLDHHGIREDRGNQVSVLTDGDKLPGLVASELREREPIRDFHGVLIQLALVTGLLFGGVPALRATSSAPSSSLKEN